MNIFQLSVKYIRSKPLSSLLSISLVSLGVAMGSFLLLFNKQFKDRLFNNLDGIDLVVSAKGSKLQMILSSVYQIDAPTGNIPLEKSFVVTKNPYVEKAIPLAMGDSYKGYRIVGTDQQYFDHFNGTLHQGRFFRNDLEVVLGSRVAQKLHLHLGDEFYGSHGMIEDGGHVHETYSYVVVGILEESNRVLDQLILTQIGSVWRMHQEHDNHDDHEHDDHEHDDDVHEHGHNHDHGNEHGHDHGHEHGHDHEHSHQMSIEDLELILKDRPALDSIDPTNKEITSYLVSYKKDATGQSSARAFVEYSNIIDQFAPEMGYAKPAVQLRRLLEMTGLGIQMLQILALIIILISSASVFIALYNSLKERKYEIAIMRVQGASRKRIFFLVILEGIIIAILGYIIGLLISHLGMQFLASSLEETYRYRFTGFLFTYQEIFLGLGTLLVGFLAAVFPAMQAYRTDISETISSR